MEKILYVVHCIDTEGPLNETIEATFERLKHIFHIDLNPSKENLIKLQNKEIDLNGKEESIKSTLNPHLLNYNNSWPLIDDLFNDCMSDNFRNQYKDSFGKSWVFNWHCVDHVDFDFNPRDREIGYHKIFDYVSKKLNETNSCKDGLHFHYHPHPMTKHAHLCATRWLGPTDKLFQILSRRIIDRNWFPSVNRPGFQVTRPDSHWFLEQFIPFDYANLSIENEEHIDQFDLSAGRSGDWRRAPLTWVPYHPSHEDYQVVGSCNRWISRCLNIGTRFANVNTKEIERAFKEVDEGKSVVLSFADHDFRDLRKDVKQVYKMIIEVQKKFPHIKFKISEAAQAMRDALGLHNQGHCKINMKLNKINEKAHVLNVESNIDIFGPQPYLSIKTEKNEYFYDNFDFQIPKRKWTYSFDEETFPINKIKKIGIGVNNFSGQTTVLVLDVSSGKIITTKLN
jgi:hypothetical protein